jgi:hypothetical protein
MHQHKPNLDEVAFTLELALRWPAENGISLDVRPWLWLATALGCGCAIHTLCVLHLWLCGSSLDYSDSSLLILCLTDGLILGL